MRLGLEFCGIRRILVVRVYVEKVGRIYVVFSSVWELVREV